MIFMLIITALAFSAGFISYKLFGPDEPIEQFSEWIIKKETGLDIDISPEEQPKK